MQLPKYILSKLIIIVVKIGYDNYICNIYWYEVYSIVIFPFLIKHYSIFNKKFLLYGLHINQSRHAFKEYVEVRLY